MITAEIEAGDLHVPPLQADWEGEGSAGVEVRFEDWLSSNPDVWLYRDRTVGLLRRYVRLAVEAGRLPALLGREFFRARVSPYSTQTFEDTVIFVCDIEACLDSLTWVDKALIATVVLEENDKDESAELLGCTYRTIARHFPEALDRLSEIFLKREILRVFPTPQRISRQACQEGQSNEFCVSDSN